MQHRDITQYRVFTLSLAPVSFDYVRDVALFFEHSDLVDFYNQQIAENPYQSTDDYDEKGEIRKVTKFFKEGSFLEKYKLIPQVEDKKLISYEIESVDPNQKEGVRSEWLNFLPTQDRIPMMIEPLAFSANHVESDNDYLSY